MRASTLRALTRVAGRDITRHRARSVLVTLLVLLPVAAMVGGIAIFRTTQPTLEAETVTRMGRADLIAIGPSHDELAEYLPAGSVVEPLFVSEGAIAIPGARMSIQVNGMDLAGLAAGMRTLVDGRLPAGGNEGAISLSVAELAAVSIGDRLALIDGPTVTVVGIVENPSYLDDHIVLLDPYAVPTPEDGFASWLIGLPPGADPQTVVDATIEPATGVQDVLIHSRTSGQVGDVGGDAATGYILILGALALVEASLIAAAAFAVSVRRRQRELGLLAATGATPGQVATTVVAEAAILGVIACIAGVALGLAGALALTPWLDELTRRRNPPLVVDVEGLVGPALIGFLAAMIAAIVPARTVARVPVLLALSGRRPPQIPARRTLRLGLVAVGLAAAMTVAGATMRGAGLDPVSILLLVGGAVVSTLGFGACGPWLLERLDRIAARLPLAGRIAFRDTARARSRSSPIVTAILAGCAASVAIGAWQTSRDAENLAAWGPSLYPDQVLIAGPGAVAAGEGLGLEEGVVVGAPTDYLVAPDPGTYITYELLDARGDDGQVINLAEECVAQGNCEPGTVIPYQVGPVAAATPALLALARAESAAEDLAAGRAVVLSTEPLTASTLTIRIGGDPDSLESTGETEFTGETVTLPVRVLIVDVPAGTLPHAFLPTATIARLGLRAASDEPEYGATSYVVQFDHPVTSADLERVREAAARYPDTVAALLSAPERPGAEFRMVMVALVLLFALSVMGVALALGEAESRPEQRSLLALGADPRLRRRIAAARAAVLALLAGVLAVPAGLLPIWGIFVSRGSPLAVPALEIAAAIVALPMLAVASSWLLSRPLPDWSAFRSVRPGE